jgi:hypothetical protein
MIFRNLDTDGDWTLGQGQQNFLRDEAAIELNIQTRLKCFLGDCFWAVEFGIDWWNLLGTRNPVAQANIVIQVRTMIANSYGVVRINSVTAETDRTTRQLTISWNIDTIFTQGSTGEVSP